MMVIKITFIKYAFATILCLFVIFQSAVGQSAKKADNQSAKKSLTKTTVIKPAKGPVKATITTDMDCSLIINSGAKPIIIKAGITTPILLNIGENKIEATATDKKSVYKNVIKVEAGETPKVEVSFFANNKFIDYIKEGNIAMVEASIKKNPTLANNGGEVLASSPIEIAIENSQLDIIKLLISKGANFTTYSTIFPLHKSVLYASAVNSAKDKTAPDHELVDYFLTQGCKITDKDDCGNTPLHSAAQAGKLDLVTYLIEKGADINAKNDLGDTPLKIAEDRGFISIINVLKPKAIVEKLQAESSGQ